MYEDYAGLLRIGETKRDASDSINGFLYQDMIAIECIIDSNDSKIYTEWIEDIFVESDSKVEIYQVKHYPKTWLNTSEIYKNLYYQYLKYKLYEKNGKNISTFCTFHTTKGHQKINAINTNEFVTKENDLSKLNKDDIVEELKKINDMKKRESYIIDEVGSTDLLNEFKFDLKERKDISETKKEIREKVYMELIKDKNTLNIMFPETSEEKVKDLIFAIAIQYVQRSYYNKPENEDYKDRAMTKTLFIDYVKSIIDVDESRHSERIKYIIAGYVDDTFNELDEEIEDFEDVEKYRKIYFSTKNFLCNNLNDVEKRFKFLNSISTNRYENLNLENYKKNIRNESTIYFEHREKITAFLLIVWKLMFNTNIEKFSDIIKENDDCYVLEFPKEVARPAMIFTDAGPTDRAACKCIGRISRMKTKPKKWYFRGNLRGVYEYSIDVNKIRDVKINGSFSIKHVEAGKYFNIECLECLDCGQGCMVIKDNNLDKLFGFGCVREGM